MKYLISFLFFLSANLFSTSSNILEHPEANISVLSRVRRNGEFTKIDDLFGIGKTKKIILTFNDKSKRIIEISLKNVKNINNEIIFIDENLNYDSNCLYLKKALLNQDKFEFFIIYKNQNKKIVKINTKQENLNNSLELEIKIEKYISSFIATTTVFTYTLTPKLSHKYESNKKNNLSNIPKITNIKNILAIEHAGNLMQDENEISLTESESITEEELELEQAPTCSSHWDGYDFYI